MSKTALSNALWQIYNRQAKPLPFSYGGNFPYDDVRFGERMLALHLDETDPAGSRVSADRKLQLNWLIPNLQLKPGDTILDLTCGPGLYAVPLAEAGYVVTGYDFSQPAIAFARQLAKSQQLTSTCQFELIDIHAMQPPAAQFDAVIFLYGQLAVMTKAEAAVILNKIAATLKPGGRLLLEMLNPEKIDKAESSWWFTDEEGLWGEQPYLHLGERFWYAEDRISAERYQILNLDTGHLDQMTLCDQLYTVEEMHQLLKSVGFSSIETHMAWDNIGLYDQEEWIVYISQI